VSKPRKSALLSVAIVCCVVQDPAPSHAQWWTARAPADYEECAASAEKAASKEVKATLLTECGVKFAARRKPGGYTYFDFMQNRHFDIAGPNPTPEEQRHIDEQYADYLSRERRSAIAAAFTRKQQQLQRATAESEKKPAAPEAASKPRVATVGNAPSRPKNASCAGDSFSCNWPRLAEGIKDFKKLFGASPDKAKRGRPSTELATSNQ
jgi:hypothetical protein